MTSASVVPQIHHAVKSQKSGKLTNSKCNQYTIHVHTTALHTDSVIVKQSLNVCTLQCHEGHKYNNSAN